MSQVEVIKIGGSLLGSPGAVDRVAAWLQADRRPNAMRLLLAGGGPTVDGLRQIDLANPLPAVAAHWAAVRMMDAHAALLPDWIPGIQLLEEPPANWRAGDYCFPVESWLRHVEPKLIGERLSVGWQTTSDAIAARLAIADGASLVLLKSFHKRSYLDLSMAAEDGVVDAPCGHMGKELRRVRIVALGGMN